MIPLEFHFLYSIRNTTFSEVSVCEQTRRSSLFGYGLNPGGRHKCLLSFSRNYNSCNVHLCIIVKKVMLSKCDCILSRGQIEVLGEITSSGFMFVFDNMRDHAGILKILKNANPNVYQFLMHHLHMNLCTVYDCCKEGDKLFVFEEHINGQTLDERFREGGGQ